MLKRGQFTVLIGSRARGTADEYSDIDVVRVGHNGAVRKNQLARFGMDKESISYIDYNIETFSSLHASGSLFVHHVLTEGKLLDGDPDEWERLVKSFHVVQDLGSEIKEQLRLCRWLAQMDGSGQSTMPLLSHMFRALKNAAIFSLAQRGVFVYDKRDALRRAFPSLSSRDIELLVTANNAFVRGSPRFSKSNGVAAAAALPNLIKKMRSISGEFLNHGQKTHPQSRPKRNQKAGGLHGRRRKEPVAGSV